MFKDGLWMGWDSLVARQSPSGSGDSDPAGDGGGTGSSGGQGGASGSGTGGSSGNGSGSGADTGIEGDNPNDPLRQRLERARRQGERTAEERIRTERDQQLAQQREFEQLAATRQQTIDALQARLRELEADVTRLEEAVQAAEADKKKSEDALQTSVNEAMKNVPEHVATLVTRLPVTEQLEYLSKHGKDITKPANSAVPGNPRADGSGGGAAGEQDALAGYFKQRYGGPPKQ